MCTLETANQTFYRKVMEYLWKGIHRKRLKIWSGFMS